MISDSERDALRRVLKDDAPSYRDHRCGHNYDIPQCPHPHCGSRDLYEALKDARTYADGPYECQFPDATENERVLIAIDAALAKACGESQNAEKP